MRLDLVITYPTEGVTMSELHEKGKKAAAEFVERIGMQVVFIDHETQYGVIPIVALDDDTLVHISVDTRKIDEPRADQEHRPTGLYKDQIDAMLEEGNLPDEINPTDTRVDLISILVIEDERALLRHHMDAARPK